MSIAEDCVNTKFHDTTQCFSAVSLPLILTQTMLYGDIWGHTLIYTDICKFHDEKILFADYYGICMRILFL